MPLAATPCARTPFSSPLVFLAPPFLLLMASSMLMPNGTSWHNQQRFFELLLLAAALIPACFLTKQKIASGWQWAFAAFFSLGLLSSLLAPHPDWALKEWARYLALFGICMVLSVQKGRWPLYVLAGIVVLGVFHSLTVILRTLFFLSHDTGSNPLGFTTGFDNIRFYGQFQVILIPVLCWAILEARERFTLPIRAILFIALSVQWLACFILGGRGVLLALTVSLLSLFFLSPRPRNILSVQLKSLLTGFMLFIFCFLLPIWTGYSDDSAIGETVRFSSSGRIELWLQAWHAGVEHFWTGIGPMHFAAMPSASLTHPHQAVLQLFAEWGGAATLLILITAAAGLAKGWKVVRKQSPSRFDLTVWLVILAELMLSQVSGVLVMPYPEIWLAIFVAIALKSWTPTTYSHSHARLILTPFFILAFGVLCAVIWHEGLQRMQPGYVEPLTKGEAYNPRFWVEGWVE